jgi:hypothetical protein
MVGMPAGDDGTRDDPLLSDRSWAINTLQTRSKVNRSTRRAISRTVA